MKRSPVPLLVCILALGQGTLWYSTGAVAIPGKPNPSSVLSESTSGLRTGNPTLTAERKTSPDENPAQQDSITAGIQGCRRDSDSESPVDNTITEKPCVDPSDEQQRLSIQLGRRIGTHDNILGEFDGVRVDYRPGGGLNLNGIAGYPVLATGDAFNPARQVFGISASNQFATAWDLNSYLIEQQENGQVDGRSIGGAIRHLLPERSLLVYLDYEFSDHSLGALMASGAWKLPFNTTVSATLDLRNHRLPDRQLKYLQQSMSVTEGWNWILPTDRLAYYTGDGAGKVSTLAVGLSHAVSQRIHLSGDVAVLDAVSDPAADATTTLRSSEYFYHLKLTGKDLMIRGDRNKLDLRHDVTETGSTSTAAIDTRYAINRFWNVIPKLRADYHSPVVESSSRWMASPTVKMEYRRNKQSGFQIEAGGKWSTGENSTADDNRSSYFVSLGYQAKF